VTVIDDVAAALLAGVLTALTAAGAATPDRACVVPGELAWDECDCGLLAVRWTGNSHGSTVTNNAPDTDVGCGQPMVNAGFNVVLLRCAPGPGNEGESPTCTQLSDTAAILHRDVFALEEGISNAVLDLRAASTILDFALTGQVPVGPQGLCVGTSYTLTVALRNTWRRCG
jgi:hypothetical protein